MTELILVEKVLAGAKNWQSVQLVGLDENGKFVAASSAESDIQSLESFEAAVRFLRDQRGDNMAVYDALHRARDWLSVCITGIEPENGYMAVSVSWGDKDDVAAQFNIAEQHVKEGGKILGVSESVPGAWVDQGTGETYTGGEKMQ